ncbi:MAG: helix-turn-helix transcriptional regulator [Clostridiales bacterium]|nr:helix-turn-helix transcriptional regulator [Clostridiales bacterium]
MSNIIIPLDKDLNSTLTIGTKEFPIQLFHDNLENFSNGFVNWHKQKQVEISVILEGSVRLNELENEVVISQGNGFVVLPGQLHAVKPNLHESAKYFTLIFDPAFLCGGIGSFFEKEYYLPLQDNACAFFQFLKDDGRMRPVFDSLFWIYQNFSDPSVPEMLQIQRKLQDLWIILFQNTAAAHSPKKFRPQNVRILQMIEYLHQNYAEKFSLDDMAEFHNISRRECCRFFKKMMNMTISEYLTEYRISKSVELLLHTTLNITEISQAVGFGSSSYYISAFKEKMDCSPLKYRNQSL